MVPCNAEMQSEIQLAAFAIWELAIIFLTLCTVGAALSLSDVGLAQAAQPLSDKPGG